jgi:hypothetical protein
VPSGEPKDGVRVRKVSKNNRRRSLRMYPVSAAHVATRTALGRTNRISARSLRLVTS